MFCNDQCLTQLLEPDQPIKIRPHLEKMDIRARLDIIIDFHIYQEFHLSLHNNTKCMLQLHVETLHTLSVRRAPTILLLKK